MENLFQFDEDDQKRPGEELPGEELPDLPEFCLIGLYIGQTHLPLNVTFQKCVKTVLKCLIRKLDLKKKVTFELQKNTHRHYKSKTRAVKVFNEYKNARVHIFVLQVNRVDYNVHFYVNKKMINLYVCEKTPQHVYFDDVPYHLPVRTRVSSCVSSVASNSSNVSSASPRKEPQRSKVAQVVTSIARGLGFCTSSVQNP